MEPAEKTLIGNSILSPIPHDKASASGIRLFLKRDDLLHPEIQGNKWRKLEPSIRQVFRDGAKGILSFGGPFSNHLHALAAAGHCFGFKTAAIVRGLSARPDNPTLSDARQYGMDLHIVPKAVYDAGADAPEVETIRKAYPGFLVLPEGGATEEAVENCRKIAAETLKDLSDAGINAEQGIHFCVAAGTGCTAAGIARGLRPVDSLLVFPAAPYGVDKEKIGLMANLEAGFSPQLALITNYIFEQFASKSVELHRFSCDFEKNYAIQLDPIYTSKLMYGVLDLLSKAYFPRDAVVVALHSGGIQGRRGMQLES